MLSQALRLMGIVGVLLSAATCDKGPTAGLKRQTNTNIKFYGLTVDQNGNPIARVNVVYQTEAYPTDWTMETRGRPYVLGKVSAVSDANGRFVFDASGCKLRLEVASVDGYRHLWEKNTSDGRPSTYGYQLIAWSELNFKMDADHPAIYVFVANGVHKVTTLPCRGGYEYGGTSPSSGISRWIANKPAWPKEPSLTDVVYSAPATAPLPK